MADEHQILGLLESANRGQRLWLAVPLLALVLGVLLHLFRVDENRFFFRHQADWIGRHLLDDAACPRGIAHCAKHGLANFRSPPQLLNRSEKAIPLIVDSFQKGDNE